MTIATATPPIKTRTAHHGCGPADPAAPFGTAQIAATARSPATARSAAPSPESGRVDLDGQTVAIRRSEPDGRVYSARFPRRARVEPVVFVAFDSRRDQRWDYRVTMTCRGICEGWTVLTAERQ
jgi:hypothetical protein